MRIDKMFKAELAAYAVTRHLIIAQEHGAEHNMHIHCVKRIHELFAELADAMGYDIAKREATE